MVDWFLEEFWGLFLTGLLLELILLGLEVESIFSLGGSCLGGVFGQCPCSLSLFK